MNLPGFIKGNRLRFTALLAVALAHAGAAVFMAWSVRWLFDVAIGHETSKAGLPIHPVVPALMATAALFITTTLQRRLTDGIGLTYVHDLRLRLFRHLLQATPGSTGKSKRANLLLPFVGDLTAIRQWVGDGLARLVLGSIITVLLLGYMALDHASLALTLAGAMAVLATLAWLVHGPLDRATRTVRRQRGLLSTFVAGRLEAAATIASMRRSRTEINKLARRSEELTSAALHRAWLVGALRGLTQSSAAMMLVLMLMVAGDEVRNGAMSPGEVLGMMSLVGVMGHALHDMGRALELFVPGRVALQRIARLMALPRRVKRRKSKRQADMEGLSVGKLAVPGIVEPINLAAAPGDVILIDGPAGSGKSALMAILGRLQAPLRGSIRINGIDLAAMSLTEQQSLIGLASQAVPLLPGSIGMNLKYRRPAASAGEVHKLIDELGMEISGLELERVLGDPRTSLSTGEYEALLVARAMLDQPALLLLDAVDGHLPDEMAARLARSIGSYPGVVVMVAQRHSLRQAATRSWRIENGIIRDTTVGGLQPVASFSADRIPAA